MSQSITDIKKELTLILSDKSGLSDPNAIKVEQVNGFIKAHSEDDRKGVINLVKKASKAARQYEAELERLNIMFSYETKYIQEGLIGGIDEAGRGPLAGPVVAACVILNPEDKILYVNDSKKLSKDKREELYDEIINRALDYGIGVVSEGDIDDINILQATYKAMTIAVSQLKEQPAHLLNDAVIIPGLTMPQEKIIKGDAKSLSIAAASILAKVTRDRIMVEYDGLFPEYGFAGNKGYGSADHIKAIKEIGPCPIHRRSFIKNFVNE